MPATEAVVLDNVCKCFPVSGDVMETETDRLRDGVFVALDNISFTIGKGTCTLIGGANGSGKSLLMSIIAGLESPSSGKVTTSARVGLVFQESDSQILGETPVEDIGFGPRNLGFSRDETRVRVEAALAETGLAARAHYPARCLSGGEKRRLAVAGVLAMDSEIIIFDEPYANMDYQGVLQVNQLVKKLLSDGKTVIVLTHEIEKCLALADRFIVLYRGKKVFDGSATEALSRELEAWGIYHPLRNPARKPEDLLWQ